MNNAPEDRSAGSHLALTRALAALIFALMALAAAYGAVLALRYFPKIGV